MSEVALGGVTEWFFLSDEHAYQVILRGFAAGQNVVEPTGTRLSAATVEPY